jgi:hypothetical protein
MVFMHSGPVRYNHCELSIEAPSHALDISKAASSGRSAIVSIQMMSRAYTRWRRLALGMALVGFNVTCILTDYLEKFVVRYASDICILLCIIMRLPWV